MTQQNNNPYHICTWQPESACAGCKIEDNINCRHSWHDLFHFMVNFIPFGTVAVIGVVVGGYGSILWYWLGFAFFFFFVWESRVLCSHCPFYAKKGIVLHCLANYGVIKLWRYHPEPMSKFEGIQFLIGAIILILFPFPLLVLGGQWLWLIAAVVAAFAGVWNIINTICPKCVNFSCPLNRVPKETVDAYLERNPVMHDAWEKSGYNR